MNTIPIVSMYGIYANIWGIFMANVTIYIYYTWILWDRKDSPPCSKNKKVHQNREASTLFKKNSPTNCSYVQIGFNYLSHSTISIWQPTSKLSLLSPFFMGCINHPHSWYVYAIVYNIKPCLKPRYAVVNRHSDGKSPFFIGT